MASTQVPFQLSIELFPSPVDKRFERIRELQKWSKIIYDGLLNVAGLTLATPGGGQALNFGRFSSSANGTAMKPQFGQVPAQATIQGFYDVDRENTQPTGDRMVFHCGSAPSGVMGNSPFHSNPTSTVDSEVKELHDAILTAITNELPPSVTFKIRQLEYSGIRYGENGYHFPRA